LLINQAEGTESEGTHFLLVGLTLPTLVYYPRFLPQRDLCLALPSRSHRRWRCDLLRGKQQVPLGLHRLDLLEQQLQPIEFTATITQP
jgi:hypothetical protein